MRVTALFIEEEGDWSFYPIRLSLTFTITNLFPSALHLVGLSFSSQRTHLCRPRKAGHKDMLDAAVPHLAVTSLGCYQPRSLSFPLHSSPCVFSNFRSFLNFQDLSTSQYLHHLLSRPLLSRSTSFWWMLLLSSLSLVFAIYLNIFYVHRHNVWSTSKQVLPFHISIIWKIQDNLPDLQLLWSSLILDFMKFKEGNCRSPAAREEQPYPPIYAEGQLAGK